MGYHQALEKLDTVDRTVVEIVLATWEAAGGKLAQLGKNFIQEVVLPEACHLCLLRALAEAWRTDAADVVATKLRFETIAVKAFSLLGPFTRGVRVQHAGRAQAIDSFTRNWQRRLIETNSGDASVPVPLESLEASLRSLAERTKRDPVQGESLANKEFREIVLAGPPTWITFCNPERSTDPYAAPLDRGSLIRNASGLGYTRADAELVLVTFQLTGPPSLRLPTIADAGSYEYFRPVPRPDDEHGWTEPIDRNVPEATPLPEAVGLVLLGSAKGLRIAIVS